MINPFIYNTPVFGDDFIGRKQLIQQLIKEIIESRSHCDIWLTGVRQSGKTSLLQHMTNFNKEKKHIVTIAPYNVSFNSIFLYTNVQDCSNREEFYRNLYQTLKNYFNFKLKTMKSNDLNFINAIKYVFELKTYIIFLIDEFDSFLQNLININPMQLVSFLGELNKIKGEIENIKSSPKAFSIILASNNSYSDVMGQIEIKKNLGSGLVIDAVMLDMFTEKEIKELANSYLKHSSIQFTDKEINYCYKITKGYPHFVQRCFYILYDLKEKESPQADYLHLLKEKYKIYFNKTVENWGGITLPNSTKERLLEIAKYIGKIAMNSVFGIMESMLEANAGLNLKAHISKPLDESNLIDVATHVLRSKDPTQVRSKLMYQSQNTVQSIKERKHIYYLNKNFITASDEVKSFAQKARLLEKNAEFNEAIFIYEKIVNIEYNYLEFWQKLKQLYTKTNQENNNNAVNKRIIELSEIIEFEENANFSYKINCLNTTNINFFGNIEWQLTPGINILLGKNGYGKSYLLKMIAGLLKRSEFHLSTYFTNTQDASMELKLIAKDKTETIIKRKKALFESSPGEIVPVLAIPEVRNIDRSIEIIQNSEDVDLRYSGTVHLLNGMNYENVIENFLFDLSSQYMIANHFNQPLFNLLQNVFQELTSDPLEFKEIVPVRGKGGYRINVLAEGNKEIIPIQKASQGTLSILALFGTIYSYLRCFFDPTEVPDDRLLQERAIIIIEEIDAHLHPDWQKKIINLLRKHFPEIQFIITAHNPFIAAGCFEYEIVVLRKTVNGFVIKQFENNFIGIDNQELHNKVFEVDDKDANYYRLKALYPFKDEIEYKIKILLEKGVELDEKQLLELKNNKQLLKQVEETNRIMTCDKKLDELTIENIKLRNELDKLKKGE